MSETATVERDVGIHQPNGPRNVREVDPDRAEAAVKQLRREFLQEKLRQLRQAQHEARDEILKQNRIIRVLQTAEYGVLIDLYTKELPKL